MDQTINGNSIGSIVPLLELILVPCILSTRPFFKCIQASGGDCKIRLRILGLVCELDRAFSEWDLIISGIREDWDSRYSICQLKAMIIQDLTESYYFKWL